MRGSRDENPESESGVTVVIEASSESLQPGAVFHVMKDLLSFVLFMHQQIPSILQDLRLEFESLQAEKKELENEIGTDLLLPRLRRQRMMKMRENRVDIKRLDKLMQSIDHFESALRLLLSQEILMERVAFVLGSNPTRPLFVYELSFSHCCDSCLTMCTDFVKSKIADGLSRKVVRTLISNGAGSDSYPGPSKLFLLVKAPPSLNLPHHFIPKRDFKFCRKLRCKFYNLSFKGDDLASQSGSSGSSRGENSSELLWYQCRHAIKGLPVKTLPDD